MSTTAGPGDQGRAQDAASLSFATMWNMGYRALVSVMPPDAKLSPDSQHTAALKAGKDPRGKAPGVLKDTGWIGYGWSKYEPTEATVARWDKTGASVGLRLGAEGVIAIDADVTDPVHAAAVQAIVERHFGHLPTRIGRAPKAAYFLRVRQPTPYKRLTFGEGHVVEVLTEGKQIVVGGIHPNTRKPYVWTTPLPPLAQLPTFDEREVKLFLDDLRSVLPKAQLKEGSDSPAPAPEKLRGKTQSVIDAVRAIRNHPDFVPTYDDWIEYAYAIRGALSHEDPIVAEDLFVEFSNRWESDTKLPDEAYTRREFRKTASSPPRLGASWLYEQAEKSSVGKYSLIDAWFEPIVLDEIDRAEQKAIVERNEAQISNTPLTAGRVKLEDLKKLPPRQWLYGHKILRKYVTFVAAPGGSGKTAWIIAMALAAASGKKLLHDAPTKPLRVWIMNLEDDLVELRRRLAAAFEHFGLDPAVLDNIRLNSGRDRRFQILAQGPDGSFVVKPDYELVVAEMLREGIDILVVDPFLRSHGVSENDNEAQDEVMRLYAQIAERANAGVVLVHHTKKGAVAGDMDSLRGGSAQVGAARAAFTLGRMTVEEASKFGVQEGARRWFVRLDDVKNNMAPPSSAAEWIRLESFHLGNGDDEYLTGDSVQVATRWEPTTLSERMTDELRERLLRFIDLGEGLPPGERWHKDKRAGERWVVPAMQEKFEMTEAQVDLYVRHFLVEGVIEVRSYRLPGQQKKLGLYVKTPAVSVFE